MQPQFLCCRCMRAVTGVPIILQGYSYCLPCSQGNYYQSMQTVPAIPQPVPAYQPMGNLSMPAAKFEPLLPQVQVPPPPLEQPSLRLWKCATCAYEYNQHSQTTCQKCFTPKERKQAPASDSSYDRYSVWICVRCGFELNLPEDKRCSGCGVPRPGRSGDKWTCARCNQTNHNGNPYCNSCGDPRTNAIEVRITLVGKKWKCSCGALTPVVLSKCQGCSRFNRDIDVVKEAFGLK